MSQKDNQRNCSECKKLLEIREVAKKLMSNLWKVLSWAGTFREGLANC